LSLSTIQNANPFANDLWVNTNQTATPSNNIRAAATTVYLVTVDNTNNSAATFLQLFNNVAPTVGTSAPDVSLLVAGTTKKTFLLDLSGIPFGTGLSVACSTTAGGNTNPSSNVTVYIYLT
jgi:hypothetical protein